MGARNSEIKIAIADLEQLEHQCQSIADSGPEELKQQDIFYQVNSGRLKLRIINDHQAELIFYQRPNQSGVRLCHYVRTPVSDPAAMQSILEQALGEIAIVNKRRTLYLVGQTRVHLDQVDQLGSFMELEVVLEKNQTSSVGDKIAQELLQQLKLDKTPAIAGSYLDLNSMQQKNKFNSYF